MRRAFRRPFLDPDDAVEMDMAQDLVLDFVVDSLKSLGLLEALGSLEFLELS
jgi:hypothetical protein